MGKKNAVRLTHVSSPSATRKSGDGLFPELLVPNQITSELGKKKLVGTGELSRKWKEDE